MARSRVGGQRCLARAAVHAASPRGERARRPHGVRRARPAARAAQEGRRAISAQPWRGEVHELRGGGLVVNDAYNANPTSMRAALLDLAERAGGRRRVAILGEMAELGAESGRYHAEIADAARRARDRARRRRRRPRPARTSPRRATASTSRDADAFDDDRRRRSRPGDAILVKASRAVGLEGIPALIEKHAQAW